MQIDRLRFITQAKLCIFTREQDIDKRVQITAKKIAFVINDT